MPSLKRSPASGYLFATLMAGAAAAITWYFPLLGHRIPFALFYAAVILSTWFGGLWPGLLAVAFSAALSAFFFLPPTFSFGIGLEDLLLLGVFLFVSLVIVFLTEKVRRAERLEGATREQLLTTLKSIGDAVISTDARGSVTFMNAVAEKLTGWTLSEAKGQDLNKIFKIINEFTRAEAQNPVSKVISEGKIVGLANHTILISRDGTQVPIDDSGAPIKDEAGKVTGVVLVFHDITERRRAQEAIRASEERYRSFVANSSEAIWRFELREPVAIDLPVDEQINLFYEHGYLAECNDTMAQMYGFESAAQITGARLDSFLVRDDPKNLEYLHAFIHSNYRLTGAESSEVDKDGNPKYFLNNLVGIIEDGRLMRAWGTQQDITERKRAEQERAELLEREQAARLKAESANRTKDEFLATLSHELRTPLTAMLGWTRMLRMKELDDRMSAIALETVERNAKAQAQLVEDLLDVSRIITGNLRLDVRPMDLMPVIEAALDSVRPAAEAKHIQIQIDFDPLAGPVLGDPTRLQQVTWNLLVNAVKFTPRGGRIEVRLKRVESHVEMIVSDTGEGIRQDFLPFIFDRFRQADSSTTRAHGGLGLGLAIVRHLVELHGGKVEAESAGEGKGASFKVSLPLVAMRLPDFVTNTERGETVTANHSTGLSPAQSETLKGLRVLIVDDALDARELIKTVLEREGASVFAAANVREALIALDEHQPQVLLSDIGMPGEDGYALIQKIRARSAEQSGQIPAAAISAYVGEENRQKALDAGFQLHIAKPLDPSDLVTTVRRLARNSKQ